MPSKASNFYREFKKFFSTGVFYILLGGIFLIASYLQIGEPGSHPSFIFLLAILGVAIVLYGTGTQAAGTSQTGNINVVIAGGAGVLAIVLGFGVVRFNVKIQEVFSSTKFYAVIELVPDSQSANLDDFIIHAELPNRQPLHLWNSGQEVQILVPVSNTEKTTELKVSARERGAGAANRSTFSQAYVIVWSTQAFKSSRPGENEVLTEGEVRRPGDIGHNVQYRIQDFLIITRAEDFVRPEGEELPIRILAE